MKHICVSIDRLKQIIETYERDKPHKYPTNLYAINGRVGLVVEEKYEEVRAKFRGYAKV